jgi:methionine aminopeptidase
MELSESLIKLLRISEDNYFIVRPGTKYRDVGNEIQKHATANGCSVVRSYCGHGIHKYILIIYIIDRISL